MAKEYTDLQLLRTLIYQVGDNLDEPGSAEQTVLDLVIWLYNKAPANEAYQEVFDIIAANYSPPGLWDFSDEVGK